MSNEEVYRWRDRAMLAELRLEQSFEKIKDLEESIEKQEQIMEIMIGEINEQQAEFHNRVR